MTRLSLTSHPLSAPHAQGWAASLVIHTLVVGAAMVTLSDVTLIPDQEPFKWEVSIVQAGTVQAKEEEAPVSPPSPQEPSEPRAVAAPSPAAEAEPVPVVPAPAIEPVRPVTEMAQAVTTTEPIETSPEVTPVADPVQQQKVVQEPEQVVQAPAPPVQPAPVAPAPEPVKAPAPMIAKAARTEPPPVSQPVVDTAPPAPQAPVASAPPAESITTAKASTPVVERPRADYGWLAQSLWKRVVELKRYPHRARLNHWEGKVVLRAVIRHDGHLEDLTLQDSSGYEELDEAAMELVREACPLHMTQPLGRSQVVVQVPITYALR